MFIAPKITLADEQAVSTLLDYHHYYHYHNQPHYHRPQYYPRHPHQLILGRDGPHGGGKVVICISFEVFVQMESQASIKGVNHFA